MLSDACDLNAERRATALPSVAVSGECGAEGTPLPVVCWDWVDVLPLRATLAASAAGCGWGSGCDAGLRGRVAAASSCIAVAAAACWAAYDARNKVLRCAVLGESLGLGGRYSAADSVAVEDPAPKPAPTWVSALVCDPVRRLGSCCNDACNDARTAGVAGTATEGGGALAGPASRPWVSEVLGCRTGVKVARSLSSARRLRESASVDACSSWLMAIPRSC